MLKKIVFILTICLNSPNALASEHGGEETIWHHNISVYDAAKYTIVGIGTAAICSWCLSHQPVYPWITIATMLSLVEEILAEDTTE